MVIWIGVEEFLHKGNVRFLGEMLSKFSKTHVFVLAISKLSDSNLWETRLIGEQIWTPLNPKINQKRALIFGKFWLYVENRIFSDV